MIFEITDFPADHAEIIARGMVVEESLRAGASLFAQLNAQAVRYAMYNGAALSQTVYGSPLKLKSYSVDLLIHPADKEKAAEIFHHCGFRNVNMPIQAGRTVFIRQSDTMLCPWIIYHADTTFLLGQVMDDGQMESILSGTCEGEIYDIRFRKLKPEAEFAMLCAEYRLSCRDDRQMDRMLAFLGEYLRQVTVEPEKLAAIAAACGISQEVHECMRLIGGVRQRIRQ